MFGAIRDHLKHEATAFDPKKAESKEMFELLAAVLPDYDRERVHASDVKKLFAWYNILLAAGKLEDEPEGEAEKKEENTNQ